MFGSALESPGFLLPVVPLWLMIAVIAASALGHGRHPSPSTRRATRIAPVVALAVE